MKKRFIMLGIVCLFMTGCQTAQKTIPEITTIAPADSAHEETETNKEERAEDASVAVKSLKIGETASQLSFQRFMEFGYFGLHFSVTRSKAARAFCSSAA